MLRNLGITDRGFGPLYVDSQPCNQESFTRVTSRLMSIYGVSQTATRIRLDQLGLLHDANIPVRLGLIMPTFDESCDDNYSDADPPLNDDD